ncbi:Rz1-like lysis system protein LysC [Acinetobacter wanghuae]|uniref:Rz1-like lysis system protein LysC n=1 Tax=Acinetobacter wanghuae TaxID=2662362 RepID=UPI003AF49553
MQACQSRNVPALPQIPASLLVPCSEYQPLSNNTMGELLTRYVESLEIGAECAAKVDAYIKIHTPSK